MKTLLLLAAAALACGSVLLHAQAAPGGNVLPKEAILKSLNKPENTRSWLNDRSIGVAEKPQITTQAILFKFGTTEIEGEQSYAQIKELGKALEDPTMKNATIEIQGHTDNVGSADSNQKLSESRAQKIVQELQQHYTLSVKQLVPSGKGKSDPVVGSAEKQTDAERAQNRRVVIKRVDK